MKCNQRQIEKNYSTNNYIQQKKDATAIQKKANEVDIKH